MDNHEAQLAETQAVFNKASEMASSLEKVSNWLDIFSSDLEGQFSDIPANQKFLFLSAATKFFTAFGDTGIAWWKSAEGLLPRQLLQ